MTPLTEASKKLNILVHRRCNNFSSNNFFSKKLLPIGNYFSQHNGKMIPFSFFCGLPKSRAAGAAQEPGLPCSGEPQAWWRSTCAGLRPCRQGSAARSGCRDRARPAYAPAAVPPTAGAATTGATTGSMRPAHSPVPEGLQQRDHSKDGHTNGQLNLLRQNSEMMPRWVYTSTQQQLAFPERD